jgi:hypothetical protein
MQLTARLEAAPFQIKTAIVSKRQSFQNGNRFKTAISSRRQSWDGLC